MKKDQEIFQERLNHHHDELRWLYTELYHNDDMFAELCDQMYQYFTARRRALKNRDLEREKNPDWFRQKDMLGMMLYIDAFAGNLKGVKKKLPYLEELGVTCIYLNPIFEAHANHRYNTANYLKADPLLGTNEDFAALCAEAKKHGIRIILDGVFSHTGSDSRYFNREGRYGDGGFDSGYVGGYRSWWGFETLPEVEEEDPSYGNFVCGKGGVIDTWLGLGASGFRLDVADELPDDFIEKIRAAVKAHGEDKLLIGEVWEDATTKEAFDHRRTYLRGHGLDATMNYPFRNAAVAFARGEDASAVGEQIMSICENYPKPALDCAMNFLSTHDTERGITAIAGEPANGRDRYWQSKRMIPGDRIDDALRRVLLAYAMLYTLPGVPCVYYGDEIGMQGYRDPFNRAYFDWNSTERRLRVPLTNLARLRRSCDAGGSQRRCAALPPRGEGAGRGDYPEQRPAPDCPHRLWQADRSKPRRLYHPGRR